MLRKRLPVVLAAAAALVVSMAPAASAAAPTGSPGHVKVASYNLYLGGDIGALLTTTNFAAAVGTFWNEVQQSNFPQRAQALADVIAEDRPDLVGLQEVAYWETFALPSLAAAGPPVDYLTILLAALADEGTPYEAVVTNTNVVTPKIPLVSQGIAVRYTDRDVLLARADLPAAQLSAEQEMPHAFAAALDPFPLPPLFPGSPSSLTVVRGWSEAVVQLRGQAYRVVNTHLEAFGEVTRAAQAHELVSNLGDSDEPILLLGDLNDDPGTGAVPILRTGLGLSDSWTKAELGATAGQDDLTSATPEFNRRIDYVLYEADGAPGLRAASAHVIGEEPVDRTAPFGPYGTQLWPSDHAGVVAMLQARTR